MQLVAAHVSQNRGGPLGEALNARQISLPLFDGTAIFGRTLFPAWLAQVELGVRASL